MVGPPIWVVIFFPDAARPNKLGSFSTSTRNPMTNPHSAHANRVPEPTTTAPHRNMRIPAADRTPIPRVLPIGVRMLDVYNRIVSPNSASGNGRLPVGVGWQCGYLAI